MRSASRSPQGDGIAGVVFAETTNAMHGDRSKPLSQRPRMQDGEWAGYGGT